MKRKRGIKDESGFTLIEIIAVLVIMGILAAVAIPKYFDLQTKAREKAVTTAVAELKARVNQHFANELLKGTTINSIAYTSGDIDTDLGSDFTVDTNSWTATSTHITFDITYTSGDKTYSYEDQKILLPKAAE